MSSVSPSEINEALDAGGATGFTSEMRNGLDTLLIMKGVRARAQNMAARAMASGGTGFRRTSGPGELMDVQLSGGQWQRYVLSCLGDRNEMAGTDANISLRLVWVGFEDWESHALSCEKMRLYTFSMSRYVSFRT